MNFGNLNMAYNMLNKLNKTKILNKWNINEFESIKTKRFSIKKIMELEKDIIEQFSLMNKNQAYIICKINNKTGDKDFNILKQKKITNNISLFNNSNIENLNWFETDYDVDDNTKKFIFYKIKEKKWTDEDGTIRKENKLLIFQYEIKCFGGIIWAIIKAPYIRLDNNKTYKFELERLNIFTWTKDYLSERITVLPLKEFYEKFRDDPPLENTGWSARSYKDQNNNITEGDFGIRLDYQGGTELNKVYQSLNTNMESDFANALEFHYNNYCKEKNIDINKDTINFFKESNNLLNSEIIFKGIQKRCEYLVGTIGYFETLATGEKKGNN